MKSQPTCHKEFVGSAGNNSQTGGYWHNFA